jgi:hypothetical protein
MVCYLAALVLRSGGQGVVEGLGDQHRDAVLLRQVLNEWMTQRTK